MLTKRTLPALAGLIVIAITLSSCDENQKGLDAEDERNPYFRRASMFTSNDEYEAAVREYEKALGTNPAVVKAHLELGLIYMEKLNDPLSAAYHFKKFLRERPDASNREQVESLLTKSQLDYMMALPQTGMSDSADMTRLTRENMDLKQKIAKLQSLVSQKDAQLAKLGQPTDTTQIIPEMIGNSNPKEIGIRNPENNTGVSIVPPAEIIEPIIGNTTSTTTPSATSLGTTYVIQKGDSLWKIATKNYPNDNPANTVKRIKEANTDIITDERALKPGMEIRLP